MSRFDCDLFVIGGGSGGVRAARIAASHGARVKIAEEWRFGGTCVMRGCVPKKLYAYASQFAGAFEDAVGFGWSAVTPVFSWEKLVSAKKRELDRLEAAYIAALENAGVEIIYDRAELEGPNQIRLVGSGELISARYILVATGGTPFKPDIPGAELAVTSNQIFDLESFPSTIVIAGGGYIAAEFASIFNGLGADTTLVYRRECILRGFDDDIREHVSAMMAARGVNIVTNAVIEEITSSGEAMRCRLNNGTVLQADTTLLALGRHPLTDSLGLHKVGVEVDSRGAILVDEFSQTNIPSIHAVGDVTNSINLTPVAIAQGHAYADTVFAGNRRSVDLDLVPSAVFCQPEIGTVGIDETTASATHGDVDVYILKFKPMLNTLSGRNESMLIKIIVDCTSARVVGVHIVGSPAAEMVQLCAIALRMGATKADLDATMALHPTSGEEIVLLKVPTRRYRGHQLQV